MHIIWFQRFGWTYRPTSIMGYVVSLLAIVFLVPVFMAVIRNGHSASDDLYQLFVYTTCTAFWWKWVAEKTSETIVQ